MGRNIPLLYVLACLSNAWVWLSIWLFYYLLYTDYGGVGILEMSVFLTVTILEIPSGAFADLFGKKTSLILGFTLMGIGNILMAFSFDFWSLLLPVVVIAAGVAFNSGAFEAITYDSLDEEGRTDEYEAVYGRQKSIILFTYVVAAALGGFLYVHFEPGVPFLLTGILVCVAAILALFLTEPRVQHRIGTSWSDVWRQNRSGFGELFKNRALRPFAVLFVLVGVVPVFMYEYIAELTIIAKGATPEQMSIFVPLILLSAALAAHAVPAVVRWFGRTKTYICIGLIYALLLVLVPAAGLLAVVAFNIFWASSSVVRQVIESKVVNEHCSSSSRATTLSTLSMIRYLPYAALVVWVGHMADVLTVSIVVSYMGIAMLALTAFAAIWMVRAQ